MPTANQNIGHGHVFPRPDGVKARCGGPALCRECKLDLVAQNTQKREQPSSNSHLSPPTEFARGRYGWPDLFWATGDMPYNQAMAWSEHHRSRSQHFERMLQLRAADEPSASLPSDVIAFLHKIRSADVVDLPLKYEARNLEEKHRAAEPPTVHPDTARLDFLDSQRKWGDGFAVMDLDSGDVYVRPWRYQNQSGKFAARLVALTIRDVIDAEMRAVTKREFCPHGYLLVNLRDGTDTCAGCSPVETDVVQIWECSICRNKNPLDVTHCRQCEYSRMVMRDGKSVPRYGRL